MKQAFLAYAYTLTAGGRGEVVWKENKCASLHREIICEVTP